LTNLVQAGEAGPFGIWRKMQSPSRAQIQAGSDPGMARPVPGGAPPPSRAPPLVRNQGPSGSLPGPDAGQPLHTAHAHRAPNTRARPQAACPLRVRSESDRGSITVTRRRAPLAATSTGAGQEDGRTIFASRCSNCCQHCCQDHSQLSARDDKPGTSVQSADTTGRSWTACPELRIRRLGVRVPPSAPAKPQVRALPQGVGGALNRCPGA